jgi:hypothetical protein
MQHKQKHIHLLHFFGTTTTKKSRLKMIINAIFIVRSGYLSSVCVYFLDMRADLVATSNGYWVSFCFFHLFLLLLTTITTDVLVNWIVVVFNLFNCSYNRIDNVTSIVCRSYKTSSSNFN